MAQARNIADGLAQADPAHAQAYKANCEAYLASLEELQEQMHALLAPCEGMPIITFHAAFDYLAQEFGLRVVAVVETDAGSAPSAQELANVAEIAREEGVKALFAEPQYDDASVDIIARESRACRCTCWIPWSAARRTRRTMTRTCAIMLEKLRRPFARPCYEAPGREIALRRLLYAL